MDTLQSRRLTGSSSIKDLAEHRGIEQNLVSDTLVRRTRFVCKGSKRCTEEGC